MASEWGELPCKKPSFPEFGAPTRRIRREVDIGGGAMFCLWTLVGTFQGKGPVEDALDAELRRCLCKIMNLKYLYVE